VKKQKENDELTRRFRKQFAPVKEQEIEAGEQTDRSSPLTLEQPYQIRFDRADVKAIEFALGTVYHREIGYSEFIQPGILGSLTATEIYLWRGLREENEKGELVHVFPLNVPGFEQAGGLLWDFKNTGDMEVLTKQIIEGFITAGLFSRNKPEEKESDDTPKNLKT
jgi:hypothetical protein